MRHSSFALSVFAMPAIVVPALIVLAVLGTAIAPARAADIGPGAAADDVRACTDTRMLARITERFAWAERNTWQRGYEIAAIERPRLRYAVFR